MKNKHSIVLLILLSPLFYSLTLAQKTILNVSLSSFKQVPKQLDLQKITSSEGTMELSKQELIPDTNGILFETKVILPDFIEGVYYRPYSAYVASGNRMEPVFFKLEKELFDYEPQLPREDNNMMFGSFIMLKNAKNEFIAILPLVSTSVGNTFSVTRNGVYLTSATYGTAKVQESIPLIAYAKSKNPYLAVKQVWQQAMSQPQIKGRIQLREDKIYPENFKYLGWCSWEHFRTKINETIISNAIKDLKQSDLPFRWVMVDDGYLDATKKQAIKFI